MMEDSSGEYLNILTSQFSECYSRSNGKITSLQLPDPHNRVLLVGTQPILIESHNLGRDARGAVH